MSVSLLKGAATRHLSETTYLSSTSLVLNSTEQCFQDCYSRGLPLKSHYVPMFPLPVMAPCPPPFPLSLFFFLSPFLSRQGLIVHTLKHMLTLQFSVPASLPGVGMAGMYHQAWLCFRFHSNLAFSMRTLIVTIGLLFYFSKTLSTFLGRPQAHYCLTGWLVNWDPEGALGLCAVASVL